MRYKAYHDQSLNGYKLTLLQKWVNKFVNGRSMKLVKLAKELQVSTETLSSYLASLEIYIPAILSYRLDDEIVHLLRNNSPLLGKWYLGSFNEEAASSKEVASLQVDKVFNMVENDENNDLSGQMTLFFIFK